MRLTYCDLCGREMERPGIVKDYGRNPPVKDACLSCCEDWGRSQKRIQERYAEAWDRMINHWVRRQREKFDHDPS